MKRIIAAITISTFALIIIMLTAGIITRAKQAGIIEKRIATLPEFTLPTIDGEILNTANFGSGPLLIVYFHPECEHCRSEIESLLGSTLLESYVKLIMISYAGPDIIRSFIREIEVNSEAKTWIVSDTTLLFSDLFGTDIIPSSYIYNEDLRLVKCFKGETSLGGILKYLGSGS